MPNCTCMTAQAPQAGCAHMELDWGGAAVLVEYEVEPASGDGWHEPRHEASVGVINVLINGTWCSVEDVATPEQVERWEQAIEEALTDEAHERLIAHHMAMREDALL